MKYYAMTHEDAIGGYTFYGDEKPPNYCPSCESNSVINGSCYECMRYIVPAKSFDEAREKIKRVKDQQQKERINNLVGGEPKSKGQ